jgi:hypothetical protein
MLRVTADCDEVPSEVLILVKDLAQHSNRHIQKVCPTLCSNLFNRNLFDFS